MSEIARQRERLRNWHEILCQQVNFQQLANDETVEMSGRLLHNLEQAIRPFTDAQPMGVGVWTEPYP